MNVTTRVVNSRTLSEKFPGVVEMLVAEPYSAVECKSEPKLPAEAVIVSPTLLNHLVGRDKRLAQLEEAPEYGALKAELGRRTRQVRGLMNELKRRCGADANLSIEGWEEIADTITVDVEPALALEA